ncbi:MAG: 5-formyltetrahydrofolate cyclo-ligase [Planctomycetaceae bacterium]
MTDTLPVTMLGTHPLRTVDPGNANPPAMPDDPDDPSDKSSLRQCARQRRAALSDADRERCSRMITDRLRELPAFEQARSVLMYVGVRSEVRTMHLLSDLLHTDKKIIVPYCRERMLGLFRLGALDELEPGRFGIPEPLESLRSLPHRTCNPESLDLLVVPGLAFDLLGHRLGYGAGYFDRLLQQVRPQATVVGLAFACQIFPSVPVDSHDVPVDCLLTDRDLYHAGD